MKTEIILLIKYLTSIYLLSFVFFTVVQKIHNLYYPKNKNRKFKNRNINDKLNKYNNKCSSKNKRLTKEERKRIERKYKLRVS